MTIENPNCQTVPSRASRFLQPGDTWRALLLRLRSLLLVILGSLSYFIINLLTQFWLDPEILAFPFDPYLPYIPSFVYVYMTYHIFVVSVLLAYVKNPERVLDLKRFSNALFVSSLVAAAIFLIMPTHVPRPAVSGDSLTAWALRRLYANDQPYNCFPSLHVTWTFIACFYLQKLIGRRWLATLASWVYFILICISTVAIRQHYTPDVIGGLVLGPACILLVERLRWKRKPI